MKATSSTEPRIISGHACHTGFRKDPCCVIVNSIGARELVKCTHQHHNHRHRSYHQNGHINTCGAGVEVTYPLYFQEHYNLLEEEGDNYHEENFFFVLSVQLV